jgi:proteasome component ECM29
MTKMKKTRRRRMKKKSRKRRKTPETRAPLVGASAASAASAAAKIPAAAAPAAMAVPTPNDNACEAILSAIFDAYLYSSRPEERCAACTWLLALVTHARRHAKLVSMLPEIQEAFGSLLGDQNELTQEMASRGVSVVYELGTEAQRKELLGSLMGTLAGEKPKRRRVKLADDTAVFSEGAVRVDDEALKRKDDGGGGGGGGGGGSLNTYKELCSIVTDIGQPDLIYKFMDLANYQAMLNSSKGAAFGFASIARRAGDALAPHLAKLLPKLYRMQHDPSPKMQEAVKGIWQAVVDDPKAAVDAHFAAVMEDLLTECGSRTWRSRQSAASALAELLSGRRFAEMEPFLERVWTASLRSVDDIKETVREAGKALCRSTRGLTVRLCDAHHSKPAETQRTIGVVAPILLNQGLLSPVKEIQGLAMDVLMRVAKHAGSAEIRPFVPEMVKCLLEALSSMEDSRLNYIEQHAPAIGMSAERLEHARLQSSKASPMGETLDVLMGHVDEATMTELVPQLGSVLRSGVGLNTRAGTCRFISRLCLRRGSLVRPHAGKLFKALLAAAAADKSQSVTSAAVSATAAVARHATEARTHQLVQDVVSMYDSASDDDSGSGDAASSEKRRALASHLALELSRNASDAVAKHAASVLPLAFVGRFDDAESVAKRWQEVWEENASGASSTLRLYLDEILAACASRLGAAQYRVKRQGAAATAAAAKAAPQVVKPRATEMLRGLMAELPGRVWEGKQVVPGAVADVLEACPECVVGAGARDEVVRALVAEAGRKKAAYREAAIEALRRALAALAPPAKTLRETETENDAVASDADFFPAVMPLLRELLQPKPDPTRDPPGHAGSVGGNTVAEMEAEAARVAAEAKTGRRRRHPRIAVLGDAVRRRDARRDSIGGAGVRVARGGRARARARLDAPRGGVRGGGRGGVARRHRGTRRAELRREPRRRSVAGAARGAARGVRVGRARVAAARRRRGRAGGGGGGAREGLAHPRGVREAAGGYARRRPSAGCPRRRREGARAVWRVSD